VRFYDDIEDGLKQRGYDYTTATSEQLDTWQEEYRNGTLPQGLEGAQRILALFLHPDARISGDYRYSTYASKILN